MRRFVFATSWPDSSVNMGGGDIFPRCAAIVDVLSEILQKEQHSPIQAALLRGKIAKEGYKQYSPSFSTEECARALGISRQAVLKRLHQGTLLGWQENKQLAYRIPVWQFDADGELLDGVPSVLKILNSPELDVWSKVLFFLQKRELLKNKCPLDLLQKGGLETCCLERFGDKMISNQGDVSCFDWYSLACSKLEVSAKICDLTDPKTLLACGTDKASIMNVDIQISQQWALAISLHPAAFDGILYFSRFGAKACLALFEKPAFADLKSSQVCDFSDDPNLCQSFAKKYKINLID